MGEKVKKIHAKHYVKIRRRKNIKKLTRNKNWNINKYSFGTTIIFVRDGNIQLS